MYVFGASNISLFLQYCEVCDEKLLKFISCVSSHLTFVPVRQSELEYWIEWKL